MELPPEILSYIFSFLDVRGIAKTRLVCKHWKSFMPNALFSPLSPNERFTLALKNKVYKEFPRLYHQAYLTWLDSYPYERYYGRRTWFSTDKLKVFLTGWKHTTRQEKRLMLEHTDGAFLRYLSHLRIKPGKPNYKRLEEIKKFMRENMKEHLHGIQMHWGIFFEDFD